MVHKNVWILAEHHDGKLRQVSFELLARGKTLAEKKNCKLCAVVISGAIPEEEIARLFHFGADEIIAVQHASLTHFLAEPYANVLTYLIDQYHPEILIGAATTTGRTLFPYVFTRVHGGLTADCTGLDIDEETGYLLQIRPAIGGNIMATIKTPSARPQMATVRPKSTAPLPVNITKTGEIKRVEVPEDLLKSRVVFEKFEPEDQKVSIEDADIIVAGGKSIRGKDNLGLLRELADALGGAVGSSRPPVDQGWAPYSMQIGLSGKTVAPKLYVACGISGAIQHLAGMQTAETIVAINNDPNAQIFQVADFGIVGNLFEIVPLLTEKVNAVRDAKKTI